MSDKVIGAEEIPPPIPPRLPKKKTPLPSFATNTEHEKERKFSHTKSQMQPPVRNVLQFQSCSGPQSPRMKKPSSTKTLNKISFDARLKETLHTSNLCSQQKEPCLIDSRKRSRKHVFKRDEKLAPLGLSTTRRLNSTPNRGNEESKPRFFNSWFETKSKSFRSDCLPQFQERAAKERAKSQEPDTFSDALDSETVLLGTSARVLNENFLERPHAKRRNAICFELHKEVRGNRAQNRLIQIFQDGQSETQYFHQESETLVSGCGLEDPNHTSDTCCAYVLMY